MTRSGRRRQPLQEPSGADGAASQSLDAAPQRPVGGDQHDATLLRRGEVHELLVAGITATRTGYFLATVAGNVHNFHTPWYGSQAGKRLPGPLADITVDPYTNGYWLATSAGNVFNYHTPFHGSEASKSLPSPFADITAAPNVHGAYWVAAESGGVYSFGAPLGAHLTADAHRCTSAELHVGEGSPHGAAGNSAVSLRFTNASGQPCTLTGYRRGRARLVRPAGPAGAPHAERADGRHRPRPDPDRRARPRPVGRRHPRGHGQLRSRGHLPAPVGDPRHGAQHGPLGAAGEDAR
ncbi:MAG TPA: DUF4232 domain-containing protein [Acidimicrobiales bacterium]|nr:DUF4232 domain-containing protein [Acidimicrobiales bacterium]